MEENLQGASGVGIAFLIGMIVLMCFLPRRLAILPLFIITCYLPLGQMFMVAGLNLQFFRILLFASWLRVLAKGEYTRVRWGRIDRLFAWWLAVTLVFGVFTQPTNFAERFINRSGEVFNAGCTYFLIRCWIRSLDEVVQITKAMAFVITPLAVSMVVEKFTARNIFSFLGGVPDVTTERDGSLRCQGAFRHPILAGTYGATMFPLFVGLWWMDRRNRTIASIGILCSILITLAATSSGALLALIGACAGFALWKWRARMRLFRWGVVAVLAALAVVMKAPVWYIFSRLSEIVGGTGWYRSFLIDQAVSHFNEWWLVGSKFTAHWAPGGETPAGNPNNTDIINHYISEGLEGGILKVVLFVAIIVQCYRVLGGVVTRTRTVQMRERKWAWAMGVCLIAHCISFMSVVYFDQIIVMWFWILAATAALQVRVAAPVAAVRLKRTTEESERSDSEVFPNLDGHVLLSRSGR